MTCCGLWQRGVVLGLSWLRAKQFGRAVGPVKAAVSLQQARYE